MANEALRVLVVDDQPDTAEILSMLFEMLGLEARSATRGREGLVTAREFDPDLVLLDIGLPDINGFEVVRALRADRRYFTRYIAAITGGGRPVDGVRAKRAASTTTS